jgi:hypothetical protein
MAGTESAFHYSVSGRIAEDSCIGFGIDLVHRGSENHLRPTLLKQQAIRFKSTRITLQVLLVVELGGIKKYAYNRNVILLDTTLDQRGMTGMQGAHRGHQTDRMTLLTFSVQTGFQFGYCLDYQHNLDLLSKTVQSNTDFLK